MNSVLTTLPAVPLALLSVYAGQKSYIAIINLQKNEERAEKAAKHSQTAARELRKTRLTQASGAATVCAFFPEISIDTLICAIPTMT